MEGVSEVRGWGLLLAARLASLPASEVVARALSRGLVVNAVTPDSVRLTPSLLASDEELDEGLATLGAVLAS
jgi:acetylornithine/succinyldiaminopimelate/putrescine aminotransferase